MPMTMPTDTMVRYSIFARKMTRGEKVEIAKAYCLRDAERMVEEYSLTFGRGWAVWCCGPASSYMVVK